MSVALDASVARYCTHGFLLKISVSCPTSPQGDVEQVDDGVWPTCFELAKKGEILCREHKFYDAIAILLKALALNTEDCTILFPTYSWDSHTTQSEICEMLSGTSAATLRTSFSNRFIRIRVERFRQTHTRPPCNNQSANVEWRNSRLPFVLLVKLYLVALIRLYPSEINPSDANKRLDFLPPENGWLAEVLLAIEDTVAFYLQCDALLAHLGENILSESSLKEA
ncbi:unnamed protein product [Angiostrongylus costaricensis]|uniref:TPR_REGION domain-containing protein n=1 Tax=Angiostrongylus costaricensis TaxID=334426 RepID=A0A0R3PST0_ANGCS|nr:unnamed protein product [Angiostrongylus costaricensis]